MTTVLSPQTQQSIRDATAYVQLIDSNVRTNDYQEIDKFHEHQMHIAQEKGRHEGAQGIPGDQGNSALEASFVSRYEAEHSRLISNEINLISRLETGFNFVKGQFVQTVGGALAYRINEIVTGFKAACARHERPSGETDAISWLLKNQWAVYAIIIVIGLMEVPLNNTIFQAFRLSRVETAIVAIVLVLIVPILAHFCGKALKRWNTGTPQKIQAAALLLIFAGFALAMGLFRYVYFHATDLYNKAVVLGEDVTLSELMAEVSYGEAFGSTEFWVAFIFNVMLLVVGVLLGYYAHDSNPDFEKHYVNYHVERKRLQARLNGVVEREQRESSAMGTEGSYTLHKRALGEIATLHEAIIKYVRNFTQHANQLCSHVVHTYHAENIAARPAGSIIPNGWLAPYQRIDRITAPELSTLSTFDIV